MVRDDSSEGDKREGEDGRLVLDLIEQFVHLDTSILDLDELF
jgi:hypothetical protein